MALLHDSVDFKKLDTRMVERNIARGVVSAEAFSQSVGVLPDDAENAEWINIESLANDLDEGDTAGSELSN
jgi:hypothetical protein